jgi:hypothetical protein
VHVRLSYIRDAMHEARTRGNYALRYSDRLIHEQYPSPVASPASSAVTPLWAWLKHVRAGI